MRILQYHERKHLEKLLQQEGSLKYIFDDFVRNTGQIMSKWKETTSDNVWYRNSRLESDIEKQIESLHDKMQENIKKYSVDAWDRANLKYDEVVSSYIANMPISEVAKRGMFARNIDAFETLLNRKIDGMTLSDRIWKVTGTAKENIEFYLQSGISTGRSADKISQDVRGLLKEPDRRFRRVRNAEGKLVMSQPMKDYHPGPGKYRSSYMNAKRLAATETNIAYRTADHLRWKSLDFVLGVEIKRAANAKPCPICDALKGKYPKDYKFVGWHPFCICIATPILMDEDQYLDYLIDGGELPQDGKINDLPSNSRIYFNDLLDKGKADLDSFLLRDNKDFFKR
jgi:hypothetical protein